MTVFKEEFMIGDGKEHVCSGCYEIIATHDPEAYQSGKFYYHSSAHETMHSSRSRNRLLSSQGPALPEPLFEGGSVS
jgi:hypothetical protein